MLCTTTSVDNPNKKGLSNNEMPPKSSFIQLLGGILIIDGLFADKEE